MQNVVEWKTISASTNELQGTRQSSSVETSTKRNWEKFRAIIAIKQSEVLIFSETFLPGVFLDERKKKREKKKKRSPA